MIRLVIYFRKQLFLLLVLLAITLFVSCAQRETWKVGDQPSTSLTNIETTTSPILEKVAKNRARESKEMVDLTPNPVGTSTPESSTTLPPSPTILGTDYNPAIDLHASPVILPLTILIPILDVDAPILGVGLTKENNMDAPKGPYGDPNWSSTFWYRGSAIPGEPGTATIAGHVNGMLGEPETFAHIKKLKPGDLIIVEATNEDSVLYFVVDEIKKYSIAELKEPEIVDRIFGVKETSEGQQPSDGISHLTLITCAGNYLDGEFDHRTVVFSTLRK